MVYAVQRIAAGRAGSIRGMRVGELRPMRMLRFVGFGALLAIVGTGLALGQTVNLLDPATR